jgi:hypothetical protein
MCPLDRNESTRNTREERLRERADAERDTHPSILDIHVPYLMHAPTQCSNVLANVNDINAHSKLNESRNCIETRMMQRWAQWLKEGRESFTLKNILFMRILLVSPLVSFRLRALRSPSSFAIPSLTQCLLLSSCSAAPVETCAPPIGPSAADP